MSLLPLGWVRRVGSLVGALSWMFSSRMADTTKKNLAICFPELSESERQLLGKRSVSSTFQTITESGPAWLWDKEKVLDHVHEVEGLELLQEIMTNGKGAIIIAPHIGNWEVFGLYLNCCGCGQSSQLYQAPRDRKLDKLIFNARSRAGATMVATDNRGVASLLKSLKSGEIVAILPDQVPNDAGGEFAPFFGKQVLTMTLVSRLIQKTGASALVGMAVKYQAENRHGWKIIFSRPDDNIYAEHMPESLQGLNASVEAVVRKYPAEYQWEYKRFKRVPEGEKRPY